MYGLILAGGQARRLGGGDKPLRRFGAGVLLDAVAARIAPQVQALAISANGDPARFAPWSLPVLADERTGLGPLSGVLAGLRWAAPHDEWLLCVPGDTPFLPADLALRLSQGQAAIGFARFAGRDHPSVARIATRLADDLAAALDAGTRAMRHWYAAHQPQPVEWGQEGPDPFANINTPAELAAAERRLRPPPPPAEA